MNTVTTIISVVILVLLVGFGVWYFTNREADTNTPPGIELNVTPGSDSGGSGY